jgi:CRP-like cAMP-binding protein
MHAVIGALGTELSDAARIELASAWAPSPAERGQILAHQGDRVTREIMLLDGSAVAQITDAEGRCVCVGFYTGPGLITPHIARTRDGISLVSLEVTADARVAEMRADGLLDMMLRSSEIRDWANAILRDELSRKTDREWCLAALGGADRLAWFRDRYPDHEALFAHGLIASFLGMTPVTLSRLRTRT